MLLINSILLKYGVNLVIVLVGKLKFLVISLKARLKSVNGTMEFLLKKFCADYRTPKLQKTTHLTKNKHIKSQIHKMDFDQ